MSGGFPISTELCNAKIVGADETASSGTAVTNGAANTLGAFVQLIAATTADATWMCVHIDGAGNAAKAYVSAHNIAFGAGGSEKIVVFNLIGRNQADGVYLFPLSVPAGTRISSASRGENIAGTPTTKINVVLFDGAISSPDGIAGVDAVGFNTATSKGATLTPGAANTKGNYAQIVASTTRDYAGFCLAQDSNADASVDSLYLFDIAIGAGGSEKVILPDLQMQLQGRGATWINGPFFISIPAGTRIAARCQSVAGTGTLNLTLYGFYQ